MGKIFTTDVFDWARDLATITRMFGTVRSETAGVEPPPAIPLSRARPAPSKVDSAEPQPAKNDAE